MQRTWFLLAVAAALACGTAAAGSGSDDPAAPRNAFRRQAGALLPLQGLSLCEAQNHSLSTVIVLLLHLNCGFACCSSVRSTGATHVCAALRESQRLTTAHLTADNSTNSTADDNSSSTTAVEDDTNEDSGPPPSSVVCFGQTTSDRIPSSFWTSSAIAVSCAVPESGSTGGGVCVYVFVCCVFVLCVCCVWGTCITVLYTHTQPHTHRHKKKLHELDGGQRYGLEQHGHQQHGHQQHGHQQNKQ
jgi:hypothetical protein